jgi:tetratricopeptide (TPR) repeat protein
MLAIALTFSLLFAGSQTPPANGERYGRVDFANSGAPAAQKDFLDGMALLHDFEYRAAVAAFRRAQAVDPNFAMAYWGEAMCFNHPVWMEQNLKGAQTALNKLAPSPSERRDKAKSEREKAYLDAVEVLYRDGSKEERDFRYEDAMAKLHARYPDDVDAAAFYGLAILGTTHAGRDVATYMRAARVLEEAWINNHDHPGLVHYLIHSYDDPAHAPLGLRAARIYAKIAPDAGHAQHMTSHIFLALGMWPETVQANIAAIAAVDRVRKEEGKSPVGCGHYPSWLGYAYLQLGQNDKARSALALCRASVESAAAMDHTDHSVDPEDTLTGAFAGMRLRYLLDTGDWTGEIAEWTLPKTANPNARLGFAFARVMREIMTGNRAVARQALVELETVGKEVAENETKKGSYDPSYRVRPEILVLQVKALLAEQEGDVAGAERLLLQAVGLEDKLPIAFGPPTIFKPTHELLGEFLLRRSRNDDAHSEFEKALARTPGRRLAQKGFDATSATKTARGSQ